MVLACDGCHGLSIAGYTKVSLRAMFQERVYRFGIILLIENCIDTPEQKMYTGSMELPIKPKPSEKYFALGARQASAVAWQVAKQYSTDSKPDMAIFRDWTAAHTEYARQSTRHL